MTQVRRRLLRRAHPRSHRAPRGRRRVQPGPVRRPHPRHLVTLSIGGNDIGFGEIATCSRLSVTDPVRAPCEAHYGTRLVGERTAALGPRSAAVVGQIRARSPRADVVVVGYLRILPPHGACLPVVPIAYGDVPRFTRIQDLLNATIGGHATAAGAAFVNPGVTTGHDVCGLPHVTWVEGIIPTSPSARCAPTRAVRPT